MRTLVDQNGKQCVYHKPIDISFLLYIIKNNELCQWGFDCLYLY